MVERFPLNKNRDFNGTPSPVFVGENPKDCEFSLFRMKWHNTTCVSKVLWLCARPLWENKIRPQSERCLSSWRLYVPLQRGYMQTCSVISQLCSYNNFMTQKWVYNFGSQGILIEFSTARASKVPLKMPDDKCIEYRLCTVYMTIWYLLRNFHT